jgi:NAD-dependent dihydropyrimidine dehydrogenase PreA subunit
MIRKISIKTFILAIFCILVSFSFAGIKKHFTIDIDKCTYDDCDECIYECPEEVITETEIDGKTVLVVDAEKCTYCEICFEICPEEAIYRDSTDVPGYDPAKDPNVGLSKEELQKKAEEKKKAKKKKKKKK